MAVVLTSSQLDYLARSESWKFEIAIKDDRNFNDAVVYTGDGVDDLDLLINRLQGMVGPYRLTVDVGSTFSHYVRVSLEDVQALKTTYIGIFGSVNKPQTPFETPPGHASAIS